MNYIYIYIYIYSYVNIQATKSLKQCRYRYLSLLLQLPSATSMLSGGGAAPAAPVEGTYERGVQ